MKARFDNLQQLNENDQLHIKHLEAKVARLSMIVFDDSSIPSEVKKNNNKVFAEISNQLSSNSASVHQAGVTAARQQNQTKPRLTVDEEENDEARDETTVLSSPVASLKLDELLSSFPLTS